MSAESRHAALSEPALSQPALSQPALTRPALTADDRTRSLVVLLAAVAQVLSGALLGADTGAISDARRSPITPAGYAFVIWLPIYSLSLAYALYQALPRQRSREVHRRSGWWLAAAFTASALWVPLFGQRLFWLAQVVILALVATLFIALGRATTTGPAPSWTEAVLLRLTTAFYLGWAICASAAGMGLTLRAYGMPARGGGVTAVSIGLLALATALALVIVLRLSGAAGLVLSASWAVIAIAVGTSVAAVRVAAVIAVLVLWTALAWRIRQARREAATVSVPWR